MRLLVFGFGYSARAIAARLRPRLDAAWGTTRDAGKFGDVEAAGVTPLLFDGGEGSANRAPNRWLSPSPDPSPQGGGGGASPPPLRGRDREGGRTAAANVSAAIADTTHVLLSIPPDEHGDPVLRHVRDALVAARPRSLVYLSTVGVYGDHAGAWVDETSECRPVSRRSHQRIEAEAAWRRFAAETGVPVAIVRLAGIYGPGRGPFEKLRNGTARRIVKPGQVFNRIHVDDIAQIVAAAFERQASGIFNGVDDAPAPPQDVIAFAANLLGMPAPPEVAFEDADLSPMARSFYGESKRVRNDKLKRELDVQLAYPTYREGLRAVFEAESAGATMSGGAHQPPSC